MRQFICVSCGKSIQAGWGTGLRGRDMKCPDCGARMVRAQGNNRGQGRRDRCRRVI